MDITLSQKERLLLEDQKKHEELCIEKYVNYGNTTKEPQLKEIFKANELVERSHLDTINKLLEGTIPDMGQKSSQNSGQNPQSQWSKEGSLTDKDMCTDILMTEKFVSSAYDTTIFEFRDTRVRDVLNHIQKEEQKHGEAVFRYMASKGMYSVQ